MRAMIGLAVLAALALFGLDTFVRNGAQPASGPAQATPAAAPAPRMITRTVALAEAEPAAAAAATPVTPFVPAASSLASAVTTAAPTTTVVAAITPVAPAAAKPATSAKTKHAKLACGPGQKRDTVHHKCVRRV